MISLILPQPCGPVVQKFSVHKIHLGTLLKIQMSGVLPPEIKINTSEDPTLRNPASGSAEQWLKFHCTDEQTEAQGV